MLAAAKRTVRKIAIYVAATTVLQAVSCGNDEIQSFDSCDDKELSGAETDVDCGGPTCDACGLGLSCREARDCASGICEAGTCVESACVTGLAHCDGLCVNTQSDPEHCGECGKACDVGQVCALGECETAGDRSSHDNLGMLENDPVWTPGKFGGSLSFDGVDDRVVLEPSGALGETGPITIEAWTKPAVSQKLCEGDNSNNGVVAKCDQAASSTNKCSWQLRYGSPDNCRLGLMVKESKSGYEWLSVGTELTLGQRYHVAGVFDGTTAKCYLDGIETGSVPTSTYLASDSSLFVGDGGFGTYFDGGIDEVRVHSRALSPEELAASHEMNATLTRRLEGVESGAQAPYAWSIESGALPDGLNLRATGQISGTPQARYKYALAEAAYCILVSKELGA